MNHLHISTFATERDLRLAIIEAGRICYESGLMHANTGNISLRLGNNRVVITPSKLCKGRMEPEDLLIIDLDGVIIKADNLRKRVNSSEAPFHLEIYRQRPDVRAVIHAHPSSATALTIADIPFPENILPEVLQGLGPVPTTRFAFPDSVDNSDSIKGLIKAHNAILIRNHGVITYGIDLEDALNSLEQVEWVAKTIISAHLLGKVNHLPDDIMSAMHEMYMRLR